MTTTVISVTVDTPLSRIAELFAKYKFAGVPVLNNDGQLEGIITEHDLISKDSLHLPTLQTMLEGFSVAREDEQRFQKDILDKLKLTARDIMNTEPLVLSPDASYEDVVRLFREHHRVNPVPVIDTNKTVLGIITRFDVLRPLHLLAKHDPKS